MTLQARVGAVRACYAALDVQRAMRQLSEDSCWSVRNRFVAAAFGAADEGHDL